MFRKGKPPPGGANKKGFSDDTIFHSNVKYDPKSKKFIFKIETASGKHEFEKNLIDTMRFVELMNKKYGKKGLKSMQSKNKDLRGNAKQQLTYMKQWMKIISESKDIATDNQFHDWMGVSGNILNDLQSAAGDTIASQITSKSLNNEESKQNDTNQLLYSSHVQLQEIEQWKLKYELLKTILLESQQKEAELISQLAQARADYEQLESKYNVLQQKWENDQDKIKTLETALNKPDYNAT